MRACYGAQSPAERLVGLRTRRRDLLVSEGAPTFSFVLDESVIRRPVGGPVVMRNQLTYLISLDDLPNVTVQVAPFAAGVHPGMKGPIKVIESDDEPDEDVAFLEGPHGDIISDDPEENGRHLETFHRLAQLALGPSESVGFLAGAAGEMALPGRA